MKRLHASMSVSLTLISLDRLHIDSRRCPSCTTSMNLHQPESGFPDRMLWTCNGCSTWFLMDIDPDKPEAVMVSLPDRGHFRAALG